MPRALKVCSKPGCPELVPHTVSRCTAHERAADRARGSRQERGYDAEQVDREIAAERDRERALGLDFRRPGSPAQGVQAVLAEGDQPETEDEADDAEDLPRADEDKP